MRIGRLTLNNFSSFQDVDVKLSPGMNVIVGENNVGKSNFLRAIDFLRGLPIGPIPSSWWPEGKGVAPLSATIGLEFDSAELEDIDVALHRDPNYTIGKPFDEFFGTHLEHKVSWHQPNVLPKYESTFEHRLGKLTARIIQGYGNDVTQSAEGPILGNTVYELLKRSLDRSFIYFPEFRQRPGISGAEVLKSTEGTNVASVLFLLKNGEREAQRKFGLIKRYFSLLFPTLRMEVTKPLNAQPRVLVEKKSTRHELPLDWIGAGIAEMLIVLTHIVSEKHRVIVLDEPELHLHPHSQRLLRDFLREASTSNQIIVVTHSPQFVSLEDIDNVIVVREVKARSQVSRLPKDVLSFEERKKISTNLLAQEKEFLFSRSVLLVEGPTEYGAMPILAKRMKRSFDENGVSLVSVEGNYFGLMIKLLEGFGFAWRAMCDRDAVLNMSRGKITSSGRDVKTSQVFHSLFNANLLSTSELVELQNAEAHVKTLKVDGKTEAYPDFYFARLSAIARRHRFKVLASDFEGLFAKENHGRLVRMAKDYALNKRLQGIFLAQTAKKIPAPLREIISHISSKQ